MSTLHLIEWDVIHSLSFTHINAQTFASATTICIQSGCYLLTIKSVRHPPLNSPSIVNCQGSGVAACYGTGTNEVNQFDAANLCGKVGARLCTATELKEDDSHGSGCNYDYHWVWSSTPCMYHRLHSRQDCTCTIHQIVCDACYAFVTPCYVYLGPHPAFIPLLSPTSAPIRPPQTRITVL